MEHFGDAPKELVVGLSRRVWEELGRVLDGRDHEVDAGHLLEVALCLHVALHATFPEVEKEVHGNELVLAVLVAELIHEHDPLPAVVLVQPGEGTAAEIVDTLLARRVAVRNLLAHFSRQNSLARAGGSADVDHIPPA